MATKPIPVRIPEEWLPRLDAAAERLGTNRARLIAFCAQTFTESFERRGTSMMPPNWERILASLDGRTRESIRYPQHRDTSYTLNESAPATSVPREDLPRVLAEPHPLRSEVRERSSTVASPSGNKPAPRPPASPRPSTPPPVPVPVPK